MQQKTSLKGFLLTRSWRDTPHGIDLYFWMKTEQGPLQVTIDKQQAICFIQEKNQLNLPAGVIRKKLALCNLNHEAVDGLYFNKQRDLNQLRQHLAYDKTQLYESEIKPPDRYLMERFITASCQVSGDIKQDNGFLTVTNPVLKTAHFEPDLSWVSLDIETEDLRGKLFSIGVICKQQERVFLVKNGKNWGGCIGKHDVNDATTIVWCDNERDALQQFFGWLQEVDPDVIIGWNVVAFDLDFLYWKCQQLGIAFDLGRGNNPAQQAVVLAPQQSGQLPIARIPGRVVLDGISSLKAAFYSFESYALDVVAEQLLGRKKLIDARNAEEKLHEIRRLYHHEPVQLAAYNLEDCRLVAAIFKHTDLLNFSIQRAQLTGLAIDRLGGSTAAFDNLYLPRLHRQGYVAPDIGSQQNKAHSPGGYVMDSQPGLYQNVLVLDFKSLYPSIIRTFKIDPLGLAVANQEPNPISGFLQAEFSRHTHILPDIVTRLWEERDQAKQDGNKPLSHAIKIIMNSFYGVLGSSGCRFFNPQLASSITKRGHQIIQMTQEQIEAQGYTVIYGDTDSVFVLLGDDRSETQCTSIGQALQASLNQWWKQTLKTEFELDSCLEIEFETHYLRFLMPTIRGAEKGSKKRYAGMVHSNGEYRMVFKGLETVRSDWTPLAREFQQVLYERIFTQQPYTEFIQKTYDDLLCGRLDDKLTYTKRLRRPLETYTSTQPPQVKAAKKMKNPGRKIHYVITLNGPEPAENILSIIDYQHYVEKQLAPVADSILYFLGTSFDRITARQMDVFGQEK